MRKIVDYIILESNDMEKFQNLIIHKINDGYQPYGNPFQSYGEGWYLFFQAMVKYEEEKPKEVDLKTTGYCRTDLPHINDWKLDVTPCSECCELSKNESLKNENNKIDEIGERIIKNLDQIEKLVVKTFGHPDKKIGKDHTIYELIDSDELFKQPEEFMSSIEDEFWKGTYNPFINWILRLKRDLKEKYLVYKKEDVK